MDSEQFLHVGDKVVVRTVQPPYARSEYAEAVLSDSALTIEFYQVGDQVSLIVRDDSQVQRWEEGKDRLPAHVGRLKLFSQRA